MEEELTEGRLLATFEKHGEFSSFQESFLSLDLETQPGLAEDKSEIALLSKLSDILDEYQEQSYLLDPFLECLVAPVVDCLKAHAKFRVSISDRGQRPSTRIGRVASLLYRYIKCRGYKTIIRFFPHEVADLSIALNYMLIKEGPAHELSNWALRYVVLLWLSLICMIPFDLVQFDEAECTGQTAMAIESLAKGFLGKAGLEREGAAILLSRFYMRKDTRSRFHSFLEWTISLLDGPIDLFTSIGLLQVICEVVQSGPAEQIQVKVPQILSISTTIDASVALTSNTIVRKFKTKLVTRVALRLLPPKSKTARDRARVLAGVTVLSGHDRLPDDSQDFEVPDEVEVLLEELFRRLQDKDTIVRWSASKGIARISERLPIDFANQVLDTIMGLFSIHSIAAASLYDLPAIAESTWHGACLACAEMARRGLVACEKLGELIEWLSKALYFDIRKGSHSIGSNVRDAAAYVLWALARAQDASALAPHSSNLARRLVTVALYDREIHIRRAASAAFQENVGRMGLFPHGIDVLRKTDFYAVSGRQDAFLVAAPQVAEHEVYRPFLFDHILKVTLRHWDSSMRRLGAQSLRLICQSNLFDLGPQAARTAAQQLQSVDMTDIHGGLLALTEIASAYHDSKQPEQMESLLRDVFNYLSSIPLEVLQAPRNELLTEASCHLIANSISLAEIRLAQSSSVPHWRKIIDYGLKHRSVSVQESAAKAMAAISKLFCLLIDLTSTLIRELKSGSPTMQQSLGRLLGALDYDAHPHGLLEAIQCVLGCVNSSSPTRLSNVEARRNCYLAMPQILSTTAPRLCQHLSANVVCDLFDALRDGLEDYTIDDRGDVGSWIRMACIRGLALYSEVLFSNAAIIPNFEEYLLPSKYHDAVGGILRQGVQRLDSVRQEAGENLIRLLLLPLPETAAAERWSIHGNALMKQLFLSESDPVSWKDSNSLFPKAARLLEVEQYRTPVLTGFVLSVGSKTDSTQRPAAASLVAYAHALPVRTCEAATYDLFSLVGDLVNYAKAHISSNAVVVPVLQTFNVLLEDDALERLCDSLEDLQSLEILMSITSKNVSRIKSVQRILESMKVLVNLLPSAKFFNPCVSHLKNFLTHQFPKVRTDTAEYLYLALQSKDFVGLDTSDRIEDILLETEWSSVDTQIAKEAAHRLIELFLCSTTSVKQSL